LIVHVKEFNVFSNYFDILVAVAVAVCCVGKKFYLVQDTFWVSIRIS